MSGSTWKEVLKAQHDDLERMQEMDAALNEQDVVFEADRVLKRNPGSFGVSFGASKATSGMRASKDTSLDLNLPEPQIDELDFDQQVLSAAVETSRSTGSSGSRGSREGSLSARGAGSGAPKLSARTAARGTARGKAANTNIDISDAQNDYGALGSPGAGSTTPTVANKEGSSTALRYNKAKVAQLQKQLDDSESLRKKMLEQNNDLQRQLKSGQEESKQAKRQVQLLEVENRKNTRRPSSSSNANDPAALKQEIVVLKRDVATAERLAKAGETANRTKETQLKRATEAVTRLKAQLQELSSEESGKSDNDRVRAEVAEERVKILEKQRGDLVSAFKKQMKLLDVIKRQKMHVESARLLSFTEEEFMKSLDWGL